jgi:hypothetical protein
LSESPSDIIEVEPDIFEVEIDLDDLAPENPPTTSDDTPPAEAPRAVIEPTAPPPAVARAQPSHAPKPPHVRPHAPRQPALLPAPKTNAQTPTTTHAPSTTTHAPSATTSVPALPPPFAEIVSLVPDERLRSLAAATLLRILKCLDSLRAIEEELTRRKVINVGSLFGGVRAQATSLLAFLTDAVVRGDLDTQFREVLDGIRFVMAHEVGKVYSYEFPSLTADGVSAYSRAELTRAWGLLNNCLQQTAITLARTADPSATGQRLFEDYRRKTENSLTLYHELGALLQKVNTAQKANGILLKHSLVRHLEHFREETMHFLMYKDWGEFGRYVDEVKRAFEEMEDFDCVLHGFAQYLTTLIHHVGMREVLRPRRPPTRPKNV